ncbi:MAG: metallophosphoesterase family protein [Acidimicrobiales bacterium]
MTVEVGSTRVEVTAEQGPCRPGAVDVGGLEAGQTYEVYASLPGRPRARVAVATTLRPPPGRLLARLATISDLHLGETGFGARGTMTEASPRPAGREPYPQRCARAAVAEAGGWGAGLLVVKGDLTASSAPAEFHMAGALLAGAPMPVLANLGNHDVRYGMLGKAILARYGIEAPAPAARDLPGLRVVLGHTPFPGHRQGRVGPAQRDRLAELAAGAGGGALVLVHHQPESHHLPRSYPPGVPARQAGRLMQALAEANPATMVSAGHTHRCRRRDLASLVVTEVGSTKDYPGVWAGYAVHEGGIRQVVRRVAAHDAIAWTERTRAALWGAWGRWAPGTIEQRCFSHTWPDRQA